MQRRLFPEVAAWLCAGFAVFCLLQWLTDTQRFHLKASDCYQYLSMARNIAAGKGIATDLLHYEENQRIGLIPAPQTVFPPGYPILIAGLELLGVEGETAGVGLSLVAFACTLALLFYLGRLLNVRNGALWCVLFLMVCNGPAWSFALRIYSESLFTAVSLLGLALLIKAEYLKNNSWQRLGILAAGAFVIGFSYWIRYAGCFLIASVVFYYGLRWLADRSLARFRDIALVTSVLAAFILPLWIRNVLLVGTLQGGNAMRVNNSLTSLASQFLSSWAQLMTGYLSETTPSTLPIRMNRILLAVAMVGVLLWAARQAVRNRISIFRRERRGPLTLMAIYAMVYALGLTYVAKYTQITYEDPRMFLPILPVVLMGFASFFPNGDEKASTKPMVVRPLLMGAMSAAAVCYCVGQGYGLCKQDSGEHVNMRIWLADTLSGEHRQQAGTMSVGDWAKAHIAADGVIMAADGQPCGFVLERACLTARVSRASPSQHGAEIQGLANRYGVRCLFLFPEGIGTQELCAASPFFAELAAGQSPDWLSLEASTPHCRVYRIAKP